MKINRYTLFIIAIFFTIMPSLDAEPLLRYKNNEYKYSILYPDTWEKSDINFHYKHVLFLSRGLYTKIRISVAKATPKEKAKWEHWQSWYTKDQGRWSRKILETKNTIINEGVTGKIIVIEYSSGKNRMLQRTLVANYKDNILIVECKAPLQRFYTYQPLFDAVMSSVKLIKD